MFLLMLKKTLQRQNKPYLALRTTACLALTFFCAIFITFFIVSIPFYFHYPALALWYPIFLINICVLYPLQLLDRGVPLFFSDVVNGFHPNTIYLALLAILIFFPHQILSLLDRLAEEIKKSLGSLKPKIRDIKAADSEKPKRKSFLFFSLKILVFVILCAVLGYLIYRRQAEGMLTWETAKKVAMVLLRFALLPFPITALFIRTRLFRKLSGND